MPYIMRQLLFGLFEERWQQQRSLPFLSSIASSPTNHQSSRLSLFVITAAYFSILSHTYQLAL